MSDDDAGTPSDDDAAVLAAGATDADVAVLSLSARDPDGQDAAYLAWHALDHRPEQARLAAWRGACRFVSTPACRAARAASSERYDRVDHVMLYLFGRGADLGPFFALGAALRHAGRMPRRLPAVELGVFDIAGRRAAPRALVGADVVPWRPALGAHLLIERGPATGPVEPDVDGVAGTWWWRGADDQGSAGAATPDLQVTLSFLDDDPVAVADRLAGPLRDRWADGGVEPLLAAPLWTPVPFAWGRHLPAPPGPSPTSPPAGGEGLRRG